MRVVLTDYERSVLDRALEHNGELVQSLKAVEEMSELTNVLTKRIFGRADIPEVVDEIADLQILLAQLSILYNEKDVIDRIAYKIGRLDRRISQNNQL